jgi:hypothetical protein
VQGPISTARRRATDLRQSATSAGDRFESTRAGRALISAFLLVTLAAVTLANLPDSQVRRTLLRVGQPYLNATGLDQSWGVFAPDGRRFVVDLVAHVRYEDGTTAQWSPPQGGPFLATYWDYRWRKWAENLMTLGEVGGVIRTPAAMWIAREMTGPGKSPRHVTLTTRFYDLYPPGYPRGERGSWRETTAYEVEFPR